MVSNRFRILKTETLPDAEALITGEITLPFLVELRPEALRALGQDAKLPGFRPGHIPEDVLVKNFGEMRILEETAELALAREFWNILKETNLSSLGRPEISITKLVPGIPLEFRIKVYLEPEFELPDYRRIIEEIRKRSDLENSKKFNLGNSVTDREVQDVVKEIKKRDIKADLKKGEKLEDKIRESLVKEKKYKVKEKFRQEIVEKLVAATKVILPKILVDNELEKMLAQFKHDVESQIKWADYLKQIKKTEEEIKKDWRDKAVDRVKVELIIAKIAEREKLEPEKEAVEHEVKHLLQHYPDADPIRARLYIYTQLQTQKVLEFLENQKS